MAENYEERFQEIVAATGFRPLAGRKKAGPDFNTAYFQAKGNPGMTKNLPYLKKGNQIYIVQDGGKKVIPIQETDVEPMPDNPDFYYEYNPWR